MSNNSTMTLTILSLLIVSLLAFSHAASLERYFNPKIVNGEDAKLGEIPYQVSLQYKSSSSHFCGGSILNSNYVITAAHCVIGKNPAEIKVIAGTVDLNDPKSTHEVETIIVHQAYNPGDSWRNDIALLKVKNLFVKSDTVEYVPLPPKGYIVKTGDPAVVSGWGRLWEDGPGTNKLQRANLVIAYHGYCTMIYISKRLKVTASQVCAYDREVERGSCHGDSGGPLIADGKLVGLVSWANGCASTIFPTVYTRIPAYHDWIQDKAV